MNTHKPKKRLGELLKDKGIITDAHIRYALQVQKITGDRLGEIFEKLGFVTDNDTVMALSEQSGVAYLDVDEVLPETEVLKIFNKKLCLNNAFLPVRRKEDFVEVAAADADDEKIPQLVSRQTGLQPRVFLSERKKIINAVNKHYYFLENPVEKLIENEISILSQDEENARGMDNLVKQIFHLAIKMRATDVHIQSMAASIDVSFRVDGVMRPVLSLPTTLGRIITSLKMRADMDIAEQRLPQDGRFSASFLNNAYDFRVSTIVSPQGENMVLRILPVESAVMGMEQLGFFKEHIQLVENMFKEPFGIILLTGPTGSGKTTTLYAGIRRLNLLEKNVITVEEPIEYDIPLLRQTQVNEKAGYSFANAVPHFLRHDPDVILVGEVRDAQTAATAVTASTTGHLVLSTLHTNSAIGAIPRMRDLGVRPFLIADSLIGVLSQRLVRKICNNCRVAYQPGQRETIYLGDPSLKKLYRGKGCDVCDGSGYFGRTLVYELLTIDEQVALLIEQEADLGVIARKARENHYIDMFDVMRIKVTRGITTTAEAVRILGLIRRSKAMESTSNSDQTNRPMPRQAAAG